jgi:hypothetical protein
LDNGLVIEVEPGSFEDMVVPALDGLPEEFKLADAAVANASLDEEFTRNGELMSLRLIYLHMIEEYARHIGHSDFLREQIDGATGE